MDWNILAVILTNIGIFLWIRSEANADRREIHGTLKEIKEEQKSFHGRLCTLEERYIQMIERFIEKRK